ncbi:MarR family winged helix-turn-helix transcriptional regulator [Streptomyces sp. NPDC002851]
MDNVVDEKKVKQVVDPGKGFELPLLLFNGFRKIIDDLHTELARQGHPDIRPAHGFALQAIGWDNDSGTGTGSGPGGTSTSEIGRRLGVSKQAAGKTVDRLIELGYAERSDDPQDARRKLVRLTPHGLDALRRSAAILDDLHAEWATHLGNRRLSALEDALRHRAPLDSFRLDASAWLRG